MTAIYVILTIIPVTLFVIEFATYVVYGNFIPKQIEKVFLNLDENKLNLELNSICLSILKYGSSYNYITTARSIFSKYYIYSIGRIPRWSPLHKKIKHWYEIATKNYIEKLNKSLEVDPKEKEKVGEEN